MPKWRQTAILINKIAERKYAVRLFCICRKALMNIPLNQIIIRNAESMIFSLLNFEYKMIFMKIQKPVLFHLSEFKRQAAALDRKIICKLLP